MNLRNESLRDIQIKMCAQPFPNCNKKKKKTEEEASGSVAVGGRLAAVS